MTSSDPLDGMTPKPREEQSVPRSPLLPPFLLVQRWKPELWDEWKLLHWPESYLMECGNVHLDWRLSVHGHGRILALVVVQQEDWVEECRKLATA